MGALGTAPLLEADGLGRRIRRRNANRPAGEGAWLWRGVTLRLAAGESLALRGPSGAGKTLLLRALSGLDEVDEGEIRFAGRPLAQWPMPAYRAKVIYLHQRPTLLGATVEDDLKLPFSLAQHRQRRYDRARVLGWLEQLGRSADFLAQPADTLSGGEQQLVALLRALQLAPQVLLLDEATASLDPDTVRAAEALLASWLAGQNSPDAPGELGRPGEPGTAGRAMIWTSHDPAQLARVATASLELGRYLVSRPGVAAGAAGGR